MIGLGTQAGLGDAEDFFTDFGPFTFPMYWDETGESWSALGVAFQPAVAVLTPDGRVVDEWHGDIDRAEGILESL